jgi:hypothetical protein
VSDLLVKSFLVNSFTKYIGPHNLFLAKPRMPDAIHPGGGLSRAVLLRR